MRVIRRAICFTELANIGPVDDNRAALLLRRIQLTEILRASERRGILHRALRLYAYDVGLFFFTPDFKRDFWRKTKVERAPRIIRGANSDISPRRASRSFSPRENISFPRIWREVSPSLSRCVFFLR